MRKIYIAFLICFVTGIAFSQQVEWNSSRILLEIEKLNTTGSVLYIAAHPDDENTRLIAYMANEKKMRTGYLSLTRGDGGQNLIGDEQSAYLGVIRTQELLEARKVDGGEQFFTRAVDFGFSKSASETFTKWDHDSVLADVVWVIRNFRPDIIITRFPADERAGHGQHTVSAMLAEEAFTAAADPNQFPEQLQYVTVWQTKRLFLNNSTWWDQELPVKIKAGDKNLIALDDGGYNALLGKSYGEIAADSRTHHKSQGFGATPTRDERIEYIELKKGDAFTDNDAFSGIYTTWERYRQGSEIKIALEKVITTYDALHPEYSVSALLALSDLLERMPSDKLIEYKKQQLGNILIACLGLWLEPVAEKELVAEGDKLKVFSSVVLRAAYPVTIESFAFGSINTVHNTNLIPGKSINDTLNIYIPEKISTSPYWLHEKYEGLFIVKDQQMIGMAENDPPVVFTYKIKIGEKEFTLSRALVYKETDAVKGEIYKPLIVVQRMEVEFENANYIFIGGQPRQVGVLVKNNNAVGSGTLTLQLPRGWIMDPQSYDINAANVHDGKQFLFTLIPGKAAEDGYVKAQVSMPLFETSVKYTTGYDEISYDHIATQNITKAAEAKIISLSAEIPEKKIAYIEGAGDKVAESLEALGISVTIIDPAGITADALKEYDVVIIGVRAYNISHALVHAYDELMQYVKAGGIIIAQYSNQDLLTDKFGPYPFTISRGRVTDENSPLAFTDAASPILNVPNKITLEDFTGWVQERGLYFATDLAPEYKTVMTFTDPGEQPQNGSIIVCDYGNGAFLYTGISFFRELPAGVPGAYRLFLNMLSYTNQSK